MKFSEFSESSQRTIFQGLETVQRRKGPSSDATPFCDVIMRCERRQYNMRENQWQQQVQQIQRRTKGTI